MGSWNTRPVDGQARDVHLDGDGKPDALGA